MKNLKLLPLLGIVMCALLSFTYLNDVYQIKDGTYSGVIHKKFLTKPGGNGQTYINTDDRLIVKIENDKIREVISYSKLVNNDKLIGLTLQIDEKGNAFVETSNFVQNPMNKTDDGTLVNYKLTIKKEDLVH